MRKRRTGSEGGERERRKRERERKVCGKFGHALKDSNLCSATHARMHEHTHTHTHTHIVACASSQP